MSSLDMEVNLLGAMLKSPKAIDAAAGLSPSDFAFDSHARIFTAIRAAGDDIALVAEALGSDLDTIGGKGRLLEIMGDGDDWHAAKYVRAVKRASQRRGLERIAGDFASRIASDDPDELIAEFVSALEAQSAPAEESWRMCDLIPAALERYRDPLPNPLRDESFGFRFRPGEMWIVGAYQKTGKTSFAMQLARQFADRHLHNVIYSYEMRAEELAIKYVQAASGYDLSKLEQGLGDKVEELAAFCSGDWTRFLEVVPAHAMTLEQTLADMRKKVRQGARCIFVDYLHLMVDGADTAEVARASRRLKLAAGELGVPIIVLSQLRKPPPDAPKRPPTSADVKQSGAPVADADGTILLYRFPQSQQQSKRDWFHEYDWHTKDPAHDGLDLCSVELAEYRHGPTWFAPAYFDGESRWWVPVDRDAKASDRF